MSRRGMRVCGMDGTTYMLLVLPRDGGKMAIHARPRVRMRNAALHTHGAHGRGEEASRGILATME